MLVVILETIGVPAAGIALILGVDRILDMARTAANITGDVTVAAIVAASEGQLTPRRFTTDSGPVTAGAPPPLES